MKTTMAGIATKDSNRDATSPAVTKDSLLGSSSLIMAISWIQEEGNVMALQGVVEH